MRNTQTDEKEITYFKSNELGEGLPYAITFFEKLENTDDIFLPSLRDFHVIFYVRKGRGSYFVDFTEYTFQANTFILISKQQLHYFVPFNENEVELISVTFNPDFIYRNESDLKHLFQFISSTHEKGKQILQVNKEDAVIPEMIFNSMREVYSSEKEDFKFKAFYHWLCLLLLHIEQIQENQHNYNQVESTENQKQAIQFMRLVENNFKTEFKVEFYVESLGISLKSLSKISNDFYKMSPKMLINERRLLEIKRLLRGTTQSVKAISFELNFDEPTNMFKFFKKHIGLTPNEFRASFN